LRQAQDRVVPRTKFTSYVFLSQMKVGKEASSSTVSVKEFTYLKGQAGLRI